MKTNITNIKRIIAKVRSMYKYDKKYKDILANRAYIDLSENTESGDIELNSISFDNYDRIFIYPTKVLYIPYDGYDKKILATYQNWDELLAL